MTENNDCEKSVNKSKSYVMILLLISLVVVVPLISIFFITDSNSNIDITVDGSLLNPIPTQPIKINFDTKDYIDNNISSYGLWASTDNATFTISSIDITLLSPSANAIFHQERDFAQFPLRIINSQESLNVEEFTEDGGTILSNIYAINSTGITHIQMTANSHYNVMITIVVFIQFPNATSDDSYISFVYAQNPFDVNLDGWCAGITTFQLQSFHTFSLDITALNFDYNQIESYFSCWTCSFATNPASQYLITGFYPYLVNATMSNNLVI